MKHTIKLKSAPVITGSYALAGPKEGAGNFGKYVKHILKDDKFGEKTFEKAECKMLESVINGVLEENGVKLEEVGALISGDLLNQIISASFAARSFDVPYIGVYNACSTLTEALSLAAILVDSGYYDNVIAATASHFATAERQYRYPLELGCTRPPQSQWTVTGAGATMVSSRGDGPKITHCIFGKVVDYGVTDANNMGAAMAPAAADTLSTFISETNFGVNDFDLILTGDLGALGSRIFKKLCLDNSLDVEKNHSDCGEMIYNICEEEYQGGSGAGCSAVVFNSMIMDKLKSKELKRIMFIATGALLSPISVQQGESIPCIAHGVVVEC